LVLICHRMPVENAEKDLLLKAKMSDKRDFTMTTGGFKLDGAQNGDIQGCSLDAELDKSVGRWSKFLSL
jgi:hypothetical protein